MQTEFQAAYAQLNRQQQQAVDAIDGPVLVVAGPGTGKTQLLSLRVANILQQTDTDAGSVLCLTFTNFAATNMRDRLNTLIGPSARKVMVRTFHSFAAEIMNLYPDYFWNGARLSVAPDAVQLEIVQAILSQLPLDNPMAAKFAGNFTMLGDVQQALRLTKEAGLTPDKLAAMIDVNAAYIDVIEPQLVEILSAPLSAKKLEDLQTAVNALPDQAIDASLTPLISLSTVMKESLAAAIGLDEPTGKTAHTGKWKRQWLQTVAGQKGMFDERRRNAWWRALVDVYAQYRGALHARGYYDYSDMLVEVITQLETQPELLASVQERFLYVLIDEFQDTNPAQLRLAHLVATHASTEGKPNLMAVGDDDQSIFAFNGAELNNMLSFRRTYPATQIFILEDNYRSTQALLNIAQGIIEQAGDRLVTREADLRKHLQARADIPAGEITHIGYPTREHQFSAIAHRIAGLQQTQPERSIAVLARSHDSLKRLSSLLNKLHVPIRYEQQNNVLDQEIIKQICALAEVVTAIQAGNITRVNAQLARLISHPMWGLQPAELWKLAVANYDQADWLASFQENRNPKLVTLANWLLWLTEQDGREPLGVMIEYLLGLRTGTHMTSPIREYFLSLRSVDETYLSALSATQLLQYLVDEFVGESESTLSDFVRFVRLNADLGRVIPDQSWYASGDHAVQVMTVHKAKGLEFDTVFLLDAVENMWQPRRTGRKPPANLPLESYGEHDDDYVRLLYVAITRAKQSFVASSFLHDQEGREVLATPLLSTVLPAQIITAAEAQEPISVLEAALGWPRLDQASEKDLLQPRLESYRLSATALLQFLDLTTGGPDHFLERQLLCLPTVTTANMAYGTAVHAALQNAQLQANTGSFRLETVLHVYEQTLMRQRIPFEERQRFLPHGQQVLRQAFALGLQLPKGGQAEFSLGTVQIDTMKLTGKLDHVFSDNTTLYITDYKTGKPLTSFATRDQAKAVKAWRHRTQLLFYALLARESGRFPASSQIHAKVTYVEAEQPKELNLGFTADDAELDNLKLLLTKVWQHITELNLPNTLNYSADMPGITAFIADLMHDVI